MSAAWLHIDVSVLPAGLRLPEGAKALKAEVSDEGRVIGVLIDHDGIPQEADWVSAQFTRAADGSVQFDKWLVVPNASDRRGR